MATYEHDKIVDVNGRPFASANAYRGARHEREMMSWSPPLRSADADLLPDHKTLTARAYDLARNFPLASGGIQIHLDNIIGSGLRLSSKPDYMALSLDAEWADEWSTQVEAKFRLWAEDPGCYIDASRRLSFAGLLGLGYRQFLTAGEILSTVEWLPGRGSKYATAIQAVDPARLSNPNGIPDTNRLRGGVGLDRMGAPVSYHIREALDSDSRFTGANTYSWKEVQREIRGLGRQQVVHIFEQERPGQTRGKTGLASVIANSYKLGRFQDISLEAATINAMYAATIETEFNYSQAADILGNDEAVNVADGLMGAQADFHGAETVKMDGVKFAHLYPGERLNFTSLNHPGPNFADFEKSFNRNLAAGSNLPLDLFTGDHSETNYSGARAGLQQAWKFFTGRRELVGAPYATAIFAVWLEEAIDKGDVTLPPGAPDFYEAKAAYCKSKWIGPGKGNIDGLKENKSDDLEMDMGTLTLEDACAAKGRDWKENLDQIARENAYREKLDLTRNDVRGYQTPEPPTAPNE